MEQGTPISYQTLARGTPVVTRDGREFGTVDHVLAVSSEDLLDGIVVATSEGIRFVDAPLIISMTDTQVACDLDDQQAAELPAPSGKPVFSVTDLEYSGASLPDAIGRIFHRPRWIQEKN